MPTPSTAKWPLPKNEDEFEDMVVDALRVRWADADAHRNGRRGQRQDGVDVIGSAKEGDARPVAQCKNTESPTLALLEAELVKAEGFNSPIAKFYFAVAARRDARLEEKVRALSSTRTKEGKYGVEILFYEDICHDLATDPALVARHFPGWPSAESEGARVTSWISGVINPATGYVRPILDDLVQRRLWTWRFHRASLEHIRPLAEVLGGDANPIVDDFRCARQDDALVIEDWDSAVAALENAARDEAARLLADNTFRESVEAATTEYLAGAATHEREPWGAHDRDVLPALMAQHIVNNVQELSDNTSATMWNKHRDRLRKPAEQSDEWVRLHAETDARGADLSRAGQRVVQVLEGLRRYLCKKYGVSAASLSPPSITEERFYS